MVVTYRYEWAGEFRYQFEQTIQLAWQFTTMESQVSI